MKTIHQKTLRNLAIACSSIGLILLFFISQTLEVKPTNIGEITIDALGKTVRICGTIENKFVSQGNHTFFDLRDNTGKIKAVIFKRTAENLEKYKVNVFQLKNGDKICITGEVDEWEHELEVKAERIER